ncbi:MAG: four helix bundle protein [Bacteroidetes bacterium]|nr:four helix bundle protein [Bacteroidota bacterium]
MGEIKSHKDLEVYKQSLDLVEEVYKLTKRLPGEEKFGLISQMRRAAVSIISNIAEGAARKNTKEYIQFLYMSLGSLSELETQIEVSIRLKFIESNTELINKLHHINSMLTGLIASLKRKL